jgi:hypothetical protein
VQFSIGVQKTTSRESVRLEKGKKHTKARFFTDCVEKREEKCYNLIWKL